MRILLDACVPRGLRRSLAGHDVSTAREMGWNRLPDDLLLGNVSYTFDVLVTVDRSIPFQQRLDSRPFAVIVLRARTNRLADLLPLVPALLKALDGIKPGEVREIKA
jgi:predicted nuclease of predicted toxin-antitoxin system